MPSPYSLPRGTTWSIVVFVVKAGKPVNLLGHRLLATVRQALVNATSDTSPTAPLWQGDSSASGIVVAIPGSTTTWSSGASIALNSYWQPSGPNATGYFYQCCNAGSGHTGTTEPTWPSGAVPANVLGQQTTPDSNGVVWTAVGQVNAATITMPASVTQALPNPTPAGPNVFVPVLSGPPLLYDVVDDDGSGGIWQTEVGYLYLTPRATLGQP